MSNVFDHTLERIGRIPRKMEINRYYHDDLKHLKKEREIIFSVSWSDNQKKEFDSFWKNNYGLTIPDYGAKLFEAISGKYNIQYIPEFFYRKVIEPFQNPYAESLVYQIKNLTEFIYGNVDGLVFPRTYLSCMNGCYRIENRLVSFEDAVHELSNIGEAIIKPSYWSGSGRAVTLIDIVDGVDRHNNKTLKEILSSYGNYFIVQERIHNNEFISRLSPTSLNTFRIITYILEGEIFCSPIALRLGVGNSVVDNCCAGGICIGVNNNGILFKVAHSYGLSDYQPFEEHPTSHILFDSYYVGDVSIIKEKAKEMHSHVSSIGIIAWDMSIDCNNRPVVIEANLLEAGIDFVQFSTGESLFQDNTEKMLRLLPKKKFRFSI